MRKLKIISDSTCDMPINDIKKLDIEIVPLYVTFGEDTYRDGIDLDVPTLFGMVKALNATPKSAAPTPEVFHAVFEKYIAEDYDVIYVGLGSGFSRTFESAVIAAREFPEDRIKVVDSQVLSSGSALLLYKVDKMRQAGKSLDEIVAVINELAPKVRAQFIVENLDFLYKGGRLNSAKYYLGRMLKAHPYIVVADNKMEVAGTPKGKIIKALDHLLSVVRRHVEEGIDLDTVMITSTAAPEHETYFIEQLSKFIDPAVLKPSHAGCVISSHCGPGTIGILYIRNVKNSVDN